MTVHETVRQLLLDQDGSLGDRRSRRDLAIDPRELIPSLNVAHVDVKRDRRLEGRLEGVAKARTVEASLIGCAEEGFDHVLQKKQGSVELSKSRLGVEPTAIASQATEKRCRRRCKVSWSPYKLEGCGSPLSSALSFRAARSCSSLRHSSTHCSRVGWH